MQPISFNSVLIIAAISVLVPAVLGLLPRLPLPGAVLEVIAGIVVGPSVLGWVRVDAPVQVLSTLGLGMLLFLAGLEIDVDVLRGPLSRLAGLAFAVSAGLGLLCGLLFWLAGQASQPILLAIILMSTSAGLLLPLLKDAGEASTGFGQLIMTASALAEIVPIMLLSLLFSAAAKTPGAQLVSLGIFLALLVLIGLAVSRVRRLRRLDQLLDHLERRSGQLRVLGGTGGGRLVGLHDEVSQRAARLGTSSDKPDAGRDCAVAWRLDQHGEHPYPQRLREARCK